MLQSTFTLLTITVFLIQKSEASSNVTEFMNLRQKRSLVFEGGAIRFSAAGIWPLYLEDPVNWRQVNCIYGFQTQYDLPKKPLRALPESNWILPYGRGLKSTRKEFDKSGTYRPDYSRMFVYAALEEFMNRNGRNGRECLLRSICENAQIVEHADYFSKILDVILTPGNDYLDEVYKDALKAGKFGVDCMSSYPECRRGDSFLDRIAVVT